MNSKAKSIACIILIALLMTITFLVAESVGQRSMLAVVKVQLSDVQAMLAFNHLRNVREIKSLLAKGCIEQAKKATDMAEDQEMGLLSGFFNGEINASTKKHISDSDPNLAVELTTYKMKSGGIWERTKCKKQPVKGDGGN